MAVIPAVSTGGGVSIARPVRAAQPAQQGIRVSPGVYRNPTTGQTYNSVNGAMPNQIPRAKPKPITSQPVGTTTPVTVPPAATTPAPTNTGVVAPGNPTDNSNTLFPNERMFEPQNYSGSPLYQFQVKSGIDQVDKSLAARGLTNSGAGIRQELNVPMMAAAQDTDRMTQVAKDNADRLYNMQNNEALRQERAGNNQWDRAYSLAQLMAQQSPMDAALKGLGGTIDTTTAAGKAQANYLAQAYKRAMGGGGGGFTPIATPSGPDYSNITPAQIAGGQSSSNGWMDIFNNAISGLLGSSKK